MMIKDTDRRHDEVKDADKRNMTEDSAPVPENQEDSRLLTYEEQEALVGDLEYGEEGWLPLDAEGYISGPARTGDVPEGQFFAPVQRPLDTRPSLLVTPSGAPIVKRMNPDQEKDLKTETGSDKSTKSTKTKATGTAHGD